MKAHWAYRRVSFARKGCDPPAASIPTTPTSTEAAEPEFRHTVFCGFDSEIDATLKQLHVLLRQGDQSVQLEIDRYLVACSNPSLKSVLLHRHTVPHYDNLPDISALGFAVLQNGSSCDDAENVQMLLLLRQCTPTRRRSKRAQREVQWKPRSMPMMQVLIRCMQGTLLGLYPRSSRPVCFQWRVGIFAFIRTLLVQNYDRLNACMSKMKYICKICIMEHLCNTILDYHPALCKSFNNNSEQMMHFSQGVFTMSDVFRNEINSAFQKHSGNVLSVFEDLESVAKSLFERCIRSYRGIIINNESNSSGNHLIPYTTTAASSGENANASSTVTKSSLIVPASRQLFDVLCRTCTVNNIYVFKYVYADTLSEAQLGSVWHLLQNIKVYDLPMCIHDAQLQTLQRLHYADHLRIKALSVMHICVFCAYRQSMNIVKRKPTSGKLSQLHCKCRLDSNTNELLCVHCNIPSIIAVQVLGKLVRVGNTSYVISVCCGEIIEYSGSGYEFTHGSCLHHHQNQQIGKHVPRSVDVEQRYCTMCRQKHNLHCLSVLDIPQRKMTQHFFCHRHMIPQHLKRTIMDRRELDLVIGNMQCNHHHLHAARRPPSANVCLS